MTFELKVEDELCSGCGNCSVSCPINALMVLDAAGGKGGGVEFIVEGGNALWLSDTCNGCGICVKACAYDALTLKAVEQATSDRELHLVETEGLEEEAEEGAAEIAAPAFRLDPEKRELLEGVFASMKKTKTRRLVEAGKLEDAKANLFKSK